MFRSEPAKYKKLMNECDEFLERIASLEAIVSDIEAQELAQIAKEACNWQVIICFSIDSCTNCE